MTALPTNPRELLASPDVRFGVTAPSTADEVRTLEDLGIDSLWVGGHVASPNPTPEVMVALARLSAQSATAGTLGGGADVHRGGGRSGVPAVCLP